MKLIELVGLKQSLDGNAEAFRRRREILTLEIQEICHQSC